MNKFRVWFQHRRESMRFAPWLRPALLLVDLIFVAIGFYAPPALGVGIGLAGILLNELLSPLIVRHVFHKELHATSKSIASLDIKVIRAKQLGSEAAQQVAPGDAKNGAPEL